MESACARSIGYRKRRSGMKETKRNIPVDEIFEEDCRVPIWYDPMFDDNLDGTHISHHVQPHMITDDDGVSRFLEDWADLEDILDG
jgi:hypothetical protein